MTGTLFTYLTPTILNIIGILCLSVSAITFASGSLALVVAKQWYFKGKPSKLSRVLGLLVNIRKREDALSLFEGGEYSDIEKRTDTQAQARGFVWLVIGTTILIIALFI